MPIRCRHRPFAAVWGYRVRVKVLLLGITSDRGKSSWQPAEVGGPCPRDGVRCTEREISSNVVSSSRYLLYTLSEECPCVIGGSKAMFKIGEFSQLAQVTVRTLHHYDQVKLLRPAFIDPDNEYRYYTLEQLPRLNRILALRDLGLSLDQIACVLDDVLSADQLRQMLEARRAELAQQIAEQQATLARVQARLHMIEHEGHATRYEVVRKSVPASVVASIRRTVPMLADMGIYRCAMYEELYAWLAERQIAPSGPEVVRYLQQEYVDSAIDMAVGVTVPATALGRDSGNVAIAELPALGCAASVLHAGDIWEIPQALLTLYHWAHANQCVVAGAYREIHLSGRELDAPDLGAVVLELQVPTTPKMSSAS